ncbi:HK97-gp10 family putative phage morphogenesis protein [Bacillus mycoides]|uniref:HK97 gp10 family phage protein n=1 Tax=Bacillus mycoides TaxID=1405 RepID=A0A4U2ZI02_BACMY|nr:HK97-gp10 family putative phage morphogenesis protein [Bacillus mycoides]TKI73330.1 HK97 gp10 family phage protein [Bacillus mycoides]
MAEVTTFGIQEAIQRFEALGRSVKTIENSALKKGAGVVKDALEESPASAHPKPPSPKESWRTGKHAKDEVLVGKVKTRNGIKSISVGWEKDDNSPHFYMKFQNWGTSKMPHPPHKGFIEKIVTRTEVKAVHEMRNVFAAALHIV